MFKIFTFSLVILLFSPCAIAIKTLYLNDIKWPPYFLTSLEKGQIGFGKEILQKCLARMNYTIAFKVLPIKRTHLYMETGELDISVYSYKADRESFAVYGAIPIFISEYGFASKKSDNLIINKLSDINNYTFGHLAGLAHTKELNQLIEQKKAKDEVIVGYDIDAMFGQLLAIPQRFQIMANSKETFLWRARQLKVEEKIKVHDITIKQKPYFVTVSKYSKTIKDPATFLANFDSCILNLHSSGEYQKLQKSYGLKL